MDAAKKAVDERARRAFTKAIGLVAHGAKQPVVEKALVDEGIDPRSAAPIARLLVYDFAISRRKASGKQMRQAALICLLGVAVTVSMWLQAASQGGTYVVAWGAILFGGIRFLRALAANRPLPAPPSAAERALVLGEAAPEPASAPSLARAGTIGFCGACGAQVRFQADGRCPRCRAA